MERERLLDIAIVARRLDVTPRTVRFWIARKLIVFETTPTGRYKVPASELARLLQNLERRKAEKAEGAPLKRVHFPAH